MPIRGPVVLIGGIAHVGKTRLARKLAAHTGFKVVHSDLLRHKFWSIADEGQRAAERTRCYEAAIASHPYGVIIEGDDLISRNRGDSRLARQGLISSDNRPDLGLLEHLKARFAARAFVVGRAEGDPAAVFAAIRRQGSETFTRSFSDERLHAHILRSAQRSRELSALAAEADITYLELAGDDEAIEAASARILKDIDWYKPSPVRRLAHTLGARSHRWKRKLAGSLLAAWRHVTTSALTARAYLRTLGGPTN